jgi:Transposase.
MKAPQFTDAQKAFITKQGEDGTTVAEVCRKAVIGQADYFKWKKTYSGMMPSIRAMSGPWTSCTTNSPPAARYGC